MENRIEKQVDMIESLLGDKQELSQKVEDLLETVRAREKAIERQKKVVDDRLIVELKKNKEAWIAAEKVRKEKWEKEHCCTTTECIRVAIIKVSKSIEGGNDTTWIQTITKVV